MAKLEKLRKAIQESQVDGLLITNEFNRRYMTGFTGTAGVAIVSQNDAVFITDFRYTEQAKKQVKEFRIVEQREVLLKEVAKQVEELGIKTLAF